MADVELVPAYAPRNAGVVDIRLPKYGSEDPSPLANRLAQMVVMHLGLPHRAARGLAARRAFRWGNEFLTC